MADVTREFSFTLDKMDFVDVRMQNILFGCDIKSMQAVVEEMVEEFDTEFLTGEREKMFECAKDRLRMILKSNAVLDDKHVLDIKCKKRTGKNADTRIAGDIVDLFIYAVGQKEVFPKESLSTTCKMIDLVPNVGQETREESRVGDMSIADKTQLTELFNIVMELQDRVAANGKDKEGMLARIKHLEDDASKVNLILVEGGVRGRNVESCEKHTKSNTKPLSPYKDADETYAVESAVEYTSRILGSSIATSPEEVSPRATTTQGIEEEEEEEEEEEGKKDDDDVEEVEEEEEDEEEDETEEEPQQQQQQKGADDNEEMGKEGKDDEESRPMVIVNPPIIAKEGEVQGQLKQPKLSEISSIIIEDSETNRSQESLQAKKSYADTVQHGVRKVQANQQSGKPTKLKGNTQREVRSGKARLQGVRRMETVPLYVTNIQVEDETDGDVASMVIDYAKSRGIKVANSYIIRYKGCAHAVGCKVMVGVEYVEIALRPETWPEDIACRRWERPDVWKDMRREVIKRNHNERVEREIQSGSGKKASWQD